MQGSFSPEAAEKFIKLMANEGHETSGFNSSDGLQDFSSGLNPTPDAWKKVSSDFGQSLGEYADSDIPEEAYKELPEDHSMTAHKDIVGQVMHRWKHHDPKPLHSGRGKGGKEGKVVKSQDQAIAIALSIADKEKSVGKKTSNHSEEITAEELAFVEEVVQELQEKYDFARCVRPDGSVYGTGGKCRKGSPTSAKTEIKSAKELTPDEKWMQDRLSTLRTLKGKSKKELLSILNQHRRVHGLTEKDPIRDIQGAILGSIHGNDSPSEIKEKRAARLAQIERRRGEQKSQGEEQSAIDQLSRMLPKGENIMDSLGNISIASGGTGSNFAENFDFTRCVRPDGTSYGTGGKCRKGVEQKGPSLQEKIRDAYEREQAARRAGDTEGARKAMREHMALAKEADAKVKKAKSSPAASKETMAKDLMRLINQETNPEKQRELIRKLTDLNNPMVKLPGGRVARSWDVKSPYET